MWKVIKDYPNYEVSDLGQIKSNVSNKILQPWFGKHGYLMVTLCKDSECRKVLIHRIVAQTFIPNLENKKEVNHLNGIKYDNRVENLSWVTPSENNYHAYELGLNNSEANKHPTWTYKPVILETDNGILEFINIKECAKFLGINESWLATILRKNLKSKYKVKYKK